MMFRQTNYSTTVFQTNGTCPYCQLLSPTYKIVDVWHTGLDQGLLSGCSSPASQTGRALPTSSPTRPPPACSRRDSSLQSTSRALTFSKTLGLREMVTTSWSKYKGRVWFELLCLCCSKRCCICGNVLYKLKWCPYKTDIASLKLWPEIFTGLTLLC